MLDVMIGNVIVDVYVFDWVVWYVFMGWQCCFVFGEGCVWWFLMVIVLFVVIDDMSLVLFDVLCELIVVYGLVVFVMLDEIEVLVSLLVIWCVMLF